ncbi:membrane protein insertase YidC [Herbinix luporum]|uniref:BIG2 domain-containing protein n=1 Tax=Herbinix luporum TaxID=1679721 RepID=A0A0K8J7Y9_9FIRM|nr:hypothetical protein [Herbinix luporum]CUH93554.1 hypothetical protein SD1D_2018 [Herbinix luporum]
MKTKFFKKLSFVLVVAMVLSVFYPAAGAFAAAKKPTLNSTNKYLHLGVEGKNKFNFNINNKQSGWKYYWESADEDIAVVNSKNGVTRATGVGKTTVTVTITDKNKEVVTKLYAKVTVRDNIKTVKITNIPEGNKLAVGQENDFNRSFVTVSGSTKETSAITRWTVDSDKANISEKGVFVANEAGEYTITARSFQSNAKYEDWKKDADTYAKYVLAEDTVKITVAPSIVEVSQVDLETVDVVFDSAMADADKNISVYELIGKAEVKQLVKKVTMSDDKKTATVQLYVPFKAGATYVVKYTDLEPESFVAATTNEEDVAKIDITTSTVVYNEATKVEFKLYNANGVDITTDKLANRVTMKSSEGAGTYFNTDTNELTIFGKNASTTITATYHTYKYDSEGNEVGVVEDEAIIIGVDKDATNITGLKAWTIETIDESTTEPTFKDVNQVLALNDNNVRLFVQFNTKTGSKEATINSFAEEGMFDFTSSDKNILIVDNKGNLFPVKEGNVVVVVSYGEGDSKTPIGAISITVHPERTVGVLSLSNTNVVLSNNPDVDDKAEVKISVKDQLGTKMEKDDFTYSVEKMSGSPADDLTDEKSNATGDTIEFSAKDMAVGTYYYKVTVGKKAAVVTVKVLDGKTDTNVAYYKLQLEDTFVDLKVKEGEINKTLGIELFGYNSNGVKVSRGVLNSGSDYILKIDSPEDKWDENNFDSSENKFTLVKVGEGGAIEKAPKGSYKVTAFDNKEVVLDIVQFSVDDTQVAPVLAEVKNRLFEQNGVNPSNKEDTNLIAAVKECFKFTLNGKDVTDNIVEVVAVGTADEFNVRTVTIKETIDEASGAFINHEVKVGLTITKK